MLMDGLAIVGEALFPAPHGETANSTAAVDDDGEESELVPPARLQLFELQFPRRNASVNFAAYESLPPSDALELLSGVDHTGMMVWPGSVALASRVAEAPTDFFWGATTSCASSDVRPVVVELGCGCGLITATVAKLGGLPGGSTVVATDGNDDCVRLASDNLLRNVDSGTDSTATRAFSCKYNWAASVPEPLVTAIAQSTSLHILGGDLLYSPDAVPLLAACTDALASHAKLAVTVRFTLAFFRRTWSDAEAKAMLADFQATMRPAWTEADISSVTVRSSDATDIDHHRVNGKLLTFHRKAVTAGR
jgi:hypothetical protein